MDDFTIMPQSSSPLSHMRNGMQVPYASYGSFYKLRHLVEYAFLKLWRNSNMTRAKGSWEKDEWKEPSKGGLEPIQHSGMLLFQ